MCKRILLVCIILVVSSVSIGCSRPPYDAKVIDESELDAPAQKTVPASGGGKALKGSQW